MVIFSFWLFLNINSRMIGGLYTIPPANQGEIQKDRLSRAEEIESIHTMLWVVYSFSSIYPVQVVCVCRAGEFIHTDE